MPKLGEEDRQRRMYGLPFALVAGAASVLRWILWPGCWVVLRAGLCYAVRIQPRQSHGPRQITQRNVKHRWFAAVYSRRQSDLGDRICDVGRTVPRRAHGVKTGVEQGQKLIRPMIVIVSAVMSAKLLYDSHGQEILHWLGMN